MRIEEKIRTGQITIRELTMLIASNTMTANKIGVKISSKIIGSFLEGRISIGSEVLSKKTFTYMYLPTKLACMHEWFAVELQILERGKTNGIPYGLDTQTLFPQGIRKLTIGSQCWFSCEGILQVYPWAMFPEDKVKSMQIFDRQENVILAQDIQKPGILLSDGLNVNLEDKVGG